MNAINESDQWTQTTKAINESGQWTRQKKPEKDDEHENSQYYNDITQLLLIIRCRYIGMIKNRDMTME